jgi:hypothetical protein
MYYDFIRHYDSETTKVLAQNNSSPMLAPYNQGYDYRVNYPCPSLEDLEHIMNKENNEPRRL